jgi:hypothetical protein
VLDLFTSVQLLHGVLVHSALTMVGLLFITYSLYAE